jgi:hypothetical protein
MTIVRHFHKHVFDDSTLNDEMQEAAPNWFSWYTKNDLYTKDKLTGDPRRSRLPRIQLRVDSGTTRPTRRKCA